MNNLQLIKEMFEHMEWADTLVWNKILENKSAASDRNMRERLYHIHLVQHAFLNLWQSAPAMPPKLESFAETPSILRWADEFYWAVSSFLKTASEEELEEIVEIPWAGMLESKVGGQAADATVGETLVQVVLHTAHHRGQICTKLKEFGSEPPLLDFIFWVWSGKPLAK